MKPHEDSPKLELPSEHDTEGLLAFGEEVLDLIDAEQRPMPPPHASRFSSGLWVAPDTDLVLYIGLGAVQIDPFSRGGPESLN